MSDVAQAVPVGFAPFHPKLGWDLARSSHHPADVEAFLEHASQDWEVRALYASQPPAAPVETQNCDCGFSSEVCATNHCMRKKIHRAGLTPDSKYPFTGSTSVQRSSAATEQATGRYEFPYNRTFQAIAAATSVYAEGVGVNVSVKAFQEAFNSFPDAQPLNEPQTLGQWQPIDTAPREPDAMFMVCAVGDARGPFVVRSDILWRAREAGTPSHLGLDYLTHWMPLPEMPQ